VASAGPYASHLHLNEDRQPRQYLTTQFLQAGCPSCYPTNRVKALNTIIWNAHNILPSCREEQECRAAVAIEWRASVCRSHQLSAGPCDQGAPASALAPAGHCLTPSVLLRDLVKSKTHQSTCYIMHISQIHYTHRNKQTKNGSIIYRVLTYSQSMNTTDVMKLVKICICQTRISTYKFIWM